MAIVELHLDRPAFKRVETTRGNESERAPETKVVTGSDETTEASEGGGGGMGRKLLLVALVGAVTFVAMRRMRSEPDEEAAIDIGTEETRPKTE
ncbi:hypothetical protein BRC81_12105 [Halobacteriales archaeon QS_1_68_20]|nr:MAG: hypothetical protein BRC81_12105 [Halobacteriales archaeon QS_1_68_20]